MAQFVFRLNYGPSGGSMDAERLRLFIQRFIPRFDEGICNVLNRDVRRADDVFKCRTVSRRTLKLGRLLLTRTLNPFRRFSTHLHSPSCPDSYDRHCRQLHCVRGHKSEDLTVLIVTKMKIYQAQNHNSNRGRVFSE